MRRPLRQYDGCGLQLRTALSLTAKGHKARSVTPFQKIQGAFFSLRRTTTCNRQTEGLGELWDVFYVVSFPSFRGLASVWSTGRQTFVSLCCFVFNQFSFFQNVSFYDILKCSGKYLNSDPELQFHFYCSYKIIQQKATWWEKFYLVQNSRSQVIISRNSRQELRSHHIHSQKQRGNKHILPSLPPYSHLPSFLLYFQGIPAWGIVLPTMGYDSDSPEADGPQQTGPKSNLVYIIPH